MKVTLKQIRESAGAMARLANAQGLPVKKAYWLGRITDQIEPELQRVEKQRVALIKKHTGDRDGAQPWPDEAVEAFEAEFFDFLNTEIEIHDLALSLDEVSPANLSALDIRALEYLITPPTDGDG